MTDCASLIRRAAGNLRKEVQELRAALQPPPAPGLYTYRLEQESHHGRVHLRIHPDGSGLLARDVTEAVHLNATAAHVARMALEGISEAASVAALRRRYQGVGDPREEVACIYALVDAFRAPEPRCPRCAFPSLERIPAFSAPVSAPYKVDLALTYRCNNACAHCYNEPGRKAMPSLTTAQWREGLDRLARLGVLHVIFTGGEPTLFPDLIELIRHADHLGPIVGMNTNGRRLAGPGYARALARAGLSHVQVTLASCRADEHNAITGAKSFDETVAGIRSALESGLHTITNTTLTQRNAGHAVEIVDFLHALGIHTFAMNGMIYSGRGAADPNALPASEMAPLLARVRDRAEELGMRFLWYTPTEYCQLSPLELRLGMKRCNAGEYSCCIEPNGDVLPCQSYYQPAGNLLCDPWERIWESPLFRAFRNRGSEPEAAGLPEKCRHCPDFPVCGGGCPLERDARPERRVLTMPSRNWLQQAFRLQRPEPPPPIPPGLYPFLKEADGAYTRLHLRVEPDGSGTLVANASAAVRLTPSGVVMVKALLEGRPAEEILRDVLALFRGVTPERAREDLGQVQALMERLLSPEDRYPILNLQDVTLSLHQARLMAPFSADLPLADPTRIFPLLARLWEAGIFHAVFLAPDHPNPEHLVRAVERAEDLGMIAGVRARASDLVADRLLQELAQAGVDHLTIPIASLGREIHDGFYGEGDHAAFERAVAVARANEVCPVAEVPLVESTVDALDPLLEWLEGLAIAEVSFFALAAPDEMPAAHRSDALPASMLPQVAALVEGAARDTRVRFFWQTPMRRDPLQPLADQVREGPRCSGDVAIRVEIDGSVIPPRGPYQAAGNLLRDPWPQIWESQSFRLFRERVEAPSHCPDCPGLAICAAACPRDPADWAEPGR